MAFDPTDPDALSDAQIDALLGIPRTPEPWEVNQAYRLGRWKHRRERAWRVVFRAVTRGELARLPDPAIRCVECGDTAFHYDHRDYEKPLDVRPVCVKCNRGFDHAKDAPVFREPQVSPERDEDTQFDLVDTLHCCRLC